MLHKFLAKNTHRLFFLFTIILFGIAFFTRIFNLTWGSPYFFHPDERNNIAYPILTSTSPLQLDQKNFDTGPLPLVIIKNTFSLIQKTPFMYATDPVGTIIVISRVFSSMFSLILLALLFYATKKIFGKSTAFFTLFLATFSVGFIQFSHFGTIEIWETLIAFLVFVLSYPFIQQISFKRLLLVGVLIGIGASIKLFSFVLVGGVGIGLFFPVFFKSCSFSSLLKHIVKSSIAVAILLIATFVAFLVTSPQIVVHFADFQKSIHFESTVADGTQPIFFTQSFQQTLPIVFQFTKVYPFLLNPLITVFFIGSFVFSLWRGFKEKNKSLLYLLLFFLVVFLPEAILFVKWTRYMLPTLPFIYILVALDIVQLYISIKSFKKNFAFFISIFSLFLLCCTSIVFAFSFFITVYLHADTRIAAAKWMQHYIASATPTLSEPFDIGLMTFSQRFIHIQTPDIYYLDHDPRIKKETIQDIINSSIILLPSQRLLRSRLTNPGDFPNGNAFYTNLFLGSLGYTKIYETPCDIFCTITYFGNPLFSYEETANVFDRPTVFIFSKTKILSAADYEKILHF